MTIIVTKVLVTNKIFTSVMSSKFRVSNYNINEKKLFLINTIISRQSELSKLVEKSEMFLL